MANRLVGNVIIVDSAMGNQFLIEAATGNYTNYHINSIAFWASDTTGRCIFSDVNTANHLMSFGLLANGTAAGFDHATQWASFGDRQTLTNLKIPVLTAGTAWIYLG